ncbi:telomere regulation protein Stn1-domain-containing protein [Lipomyces tetrasporus]|uniref:CST complex subunit STN1 n=1 Tax=Lipomyces tetrasporus TaxID=54092 RepID=A0AAD7R0F8_9ASCO|nr:telomere regulation protein Stn1-domain-containing protein [Lipomyces tetrasporus]KAJ8103292.1 telomere regulation protein Stn1-domain-containing protein [Lipomyces tetrasporus]
MAKRKKRNTIARHGHDPKQQQQPTSLKEGPNFRTDPSTGTNRHRQPGKKCRKKQRQVSYAQQRREREMLEIQASKYAHVGIMRQLESPKANVAAECRGSSSEVNRARNSDHSRDNYSDDSYYSETPQGQIRPARASRQLAVLESSPTHNYDKDLQLGKFGRDVEANMYRQLGSTSVEIPFHFDIQLPIIPQSGRVSNHNSHGNSAARNSGLFLPHEQAGLTEIELPLPSSPILSSPTVDTPSKCSPVSTSTVRLDFNYELSRRPKSTSTLLELSRRQQREVQLFKELQSKQLGKEEVEIEIASSECDIANDVDIIPTARRHAASAEPNVQLYKTEIELSGVENMEDIVSAEMAKKQRKKKKEKYSVTINEGITMIRIASSPRGKCGAIQNRAECAAQTTQARTEVGHGRRFVTLDDLPEFGCDPFAVAQPAISPASFASAKHVTATTPPAQKPVNRPKSKHELDIILTCANGMPFYTRNTYFKSPIYGSWACLSIADVQALKQIPATQMYGDHFWKNHPIKYICILGICVGVTIRETNATVKVDDGSGREIECILKDQTKFRLIESIDPGTFLRVLGTIGYYRNVKQLDINTVAVVQDPYAEVEFWEQMLATRDIIDEPWNLTDKDFSVEDRERLSGNCNIDRR